MGPSTAEFRGAILDGHKGAAVETPFDPQERWGLPPQPLWKGRRGHRVSGAIHRVRFESCIVPRAGRFFLLIDEALMAQLGVAIGDVVDISIEPALQSPVMTDSSSSRPPAKK